MHKLNTYTQINSYFHWKQMYVCNHYSGFMFNDHFVYRTHGCMIIDIEHCNLINFLKGKINKLIMKIQNQLQTITE